MQMQMQKKSGTGGLNPAGTGICRYAEYRQVPAADLGPGTSLHLLLYYTELVTRHMLAGLLTILFRSIADI